MDMVEGASLRTSVVRVPTINQIVGHRFSELAKTFWPHPASLPIEVSSWLVESSEDDIQWKSKETASEDGIKLENILDAAKNLAKQEILRFESTVLVESVYRELYNEDFDVSRVMILEFSRYFENFLWPSFNHERCSKAHIMSVVLLANEKLRQSMPVWDSFLCSSSVAHSNLSHGENSLPVLRCMVELFASQKEVKATKDAKEILSQKENIESSAAKRKNPVQTSSQPSMAAPTSSEFTEEDASSLSNFYGLNAVETVCTAIKQERFLEKSEASDSTMALPLSNFTLSFELNQQFYIEKFRRFFYSVLHLQSTEQLSSAENIFILKFLIGCFQSLEQVMLRRCCLSMCGPSMWSHLSKSFRDDFLAQNASALLLWKRVLRLHKRMKISEEAESLLPLLKDSKELFFTNRKAQFDFFVGVINRDYFSALIDGFLFQIEDKYWEQYVSQSSSSDSAIKAIMYVERFVEFLVDLLSQLPTRRMIRPLLLAKQVSVRCRLSAVALHVEGNLFNQLVNMLHFYESFEINDESGLPLSYLEYIDLHYRKVQDLQRVCFQLSKENSMLKQLSLSNIASINSAQFLYQTFNSLSFAVLYELAHRLHLVQLSDLQASEDSVVLVGVSGCDTRKKSKVSNQVEAERDSSINQTVNVIDGQPFDNQAIAAPEGPPLKKKARLGKQDKRYSKKFLKRYLVAVLMHYLQLRPSQLSQINRTPLYPNEQLLWNPNMIPSDEYGYTKLSKAGAASIGSSLALPKLNLQFLTIHDYLLRNYNLFRLESAYEIREDLEDAIKRMKPVLNESTMITEFSGSCRMALEVQNFMITKVEKPRLGQEVPGGVYAEIVISLKEQHAKERNRRNAKMLSASGKHSGLPGERSLPGGAGGSLARSEWDSLRKFDVLFLVSIAALPPKSEEGYDINESGFLAGSHHHRIGVDKLQSISQSGSGLLEKSSNLNNAASTSHSDISTQTRRSNLGVEHGRSLQNDSQASRTASQASFPEQFGVMAVRGAEVLEVLDEEGNVISDLQSSFEGSDGYLSSFSIEPVGDIRTIRVLLDPAQYQIDVASGEVNEEREDVADEIGVNFTQETGIYANDSNSVAFYDNSVSREDGTTENRRRNLPGGSAESALSRQSEAFSSSPAESNGLSGVEDAGNLQNSSFLGSSMKNSRYAEVSSTFNGSSDIYGSFNLLIRRKSKENNFKAILETIRNLMNKPEDTVIPIWLHDLFLGYGDPGSAQYFRMSTQLTSLDFLDTFLDQEHIRSSFTGIEDIVFEEEDMRPPYKLQFVHGEERELGKGSGEEGVVAKSGEGNSHTEATYSRLEVTGYKQENMGPYPECERRRNRVRFTPVQIQCIYSGVNPGLTMVVGPPGSGKTDVAVQIINLLYHNFPEQRILLVAHSNQALNDLFYKIVELDIDERYLLRLGIGEQDLGLEKDFSKWGRVNFMLQRRLDLLQKIQRLSDSLGIPLVGNFTCESAVHFNLYHVIRRIENFRKCVLEAGRDGLNLERILAKLEKEEGADFFYDEAFGLEVELAKETCRMKMKKQSKDDAFVETDEDSSNEAFLRKTLGKQPASRVTGDLHTNISDSDADKGEMFMEKKEKTDEEDEENPKSLKFTENSAEDGLELEAANSPEEEASAAPVDYHSDEPSASETGASRGSFGAENEISEFANATLQAFKRGRSVIEIFFPFKKFFSDTPKPLFSGDFDEDYEVAEGCFRYLRGIFEEIEECRAFELLRTASNRANYLLMNHAKIIAMTCTHAALTRQSLIDLNFKYDSLIMEETAQILEVETFIPMLIQQAEHGVSRLKRVVLIGDHHQLPPVVQNKAFQQYSKLDQSLFARFIRLKTPAFQLDSQGRARPEICDLYAWAYEKLENLPNVLSSSEYMKSNGGLLLNFQFIDVSDFNGVGETAPLPHFYQNLGEAEYAVGLYMYMRIIGYPSEKITILTTYNGQKALIQDIVQQRCAWNPAIGWPHKISTVDKYQGQQDDYIILSLVRTERVGHLRDVRRLVVAMSRSRLGLYIFGRWSLFNNCFELSPVMNRLSQRPIQLALVMNEDYHSYRESGALASPHFVNDVSEMFEIVQSKAQEVVQQLRNKLKGRASSSRAESGAEYAPPTNGDTLGLNFSNDRTARNYTVRGVVDSQSSSKNLTTAPIPPPPPRILNVGSNKKGEIPQVPEPKSCTSRGLSPGSSNMETLGSADVPPQFSGHMQQMVPPSPLTSGRRESTGQASHIMQSQPSPPSFHSTFTKASFPPFPPTVSPRGPQSALPINRLPLPPNSGQLTPRSPPPDGRLLLSPPQGLNQNLPGNYTQNIMNQRELGYHRTSNPPSNQYSPTGLLGTPPFQLPTGALGFFNPRPMPMPSDPNTVRGRYSKSQQTGHKNGGALP